MQEREKNERNFGLSGGGRSWERSGPAGGPAERSREGVHPCNGVQSVWTNVPGWKCVNDVEHLPNKFQQFLNRPEVNHKFGELVITMNEVTGAGEHRSGRFEKKRMKLALVGFAMQLVLF